MAANCICISTFILHMTMAVHSTALAAKQLSFIGSLKLQAVRALKSMTPPFTLVVIHGISSLGQWVLAKILQSHMVLLPLSFGTQVVLPGTCPTKGNLIKFEISSNFGVLYFTSCSTDRNKILHTSRQCNCRDVCKISL